MKLRFFLISTLLFSYFNRAPATALASTLDPASMQESTAPPTKPHAQEPTSIGSSLQDTLREASAALQSGQFEKARALAEAALNRSRSEGDQLAEGSALNTLGAVAQNVGEYAKSRVLLEQSLAIFEAHGEQHGISSVQFNLGSLAKLEGNYTEARDFYQKALKGFEATGDLRGKGSALLNLGGDSSEIVEIAKRSGDKNLEARALQSWGDGLFTKGDFGAAEEKIEEAGKRFRELGDENDYARVLTSLGRIQRAHGRPQDAIPLYLRALEIQKKTGDTLGQVQSLNAVAVSYNFLGDGRTAKEYYLEALPLAQKTGSPRAIDFIQGNLAATEAALGEFDAAEAALKAVIARGADENPDTRYAALGHVYLAMHRYEEALIASNRSVELARQGRQERVPMLLAGRADIERHLNQVQQAQTDLTDALNMLEEQRRHLMPTDFMKKGFTAFYQNIFSAAIGFYEQMGEAERSLEVAESARAREFIDLLATRAVQLKEKDKAAIAEYRKAADERPPDAADSSGTSPGDRLGLTLRGGSDRVSQPLPELRSSDPGLLSFVSAEPPKIEEMVAAAKRLRSSILCYWTAEEEAYVWIISPSGSIKSKRIEVRQTHLAELVRATIFVADRRSKGAGETLLAARGGTVVLPRSRDEAWRELYTLLIAPVRTDLPAPVGSRLTIIPHGPLSGLSFAGLLSPQGRYLVEDYEIHYAPSVSLLVIAGTKPRRDKALGRKYLLVADPILWPAAAGQKTLPRLPAAQSEVRGIAKRLPAGDSTLLIGADATESAFRSAVRGKRVLHLATHAIVNSGEPPDSYLLLAGDGSSSTNDGRLTAEEIYGLDLDADLVVLSACRTGAGTGSLGGEGIANLARAFFYAGSSSLMVTLWDVEDTASSELLKRFYQDWPGKQDKSAALRRAQLSLIRALREGKVHAQTPAGPVTLPEHPFFWAGFILIGEP